MSDAAPSDLPQRVLGLARAMVAAARNRALYPPDHPAVDASLSRPRAALADAAHGRPLAVGITPAALVRDEAEAIDHGPAAEAAARLHARDILRLVFASALAAPAVREFVEVIASDPVSLRERGGPAEVWRSADLASKDRRPLGSPTSSKRSRPTRSDAVACSGSHGPCSARRRSVAATNSRACGTRWKSGS